MLLTQFKTPARARTRSRLQVRSLEDRVTPATLLVDATHSFVSQLAAANSGDVLQIEPNATIGVLGTAGLTTQAASAGDTTIAVTSAFAAGQLVTINDGFHSETALVDGVLGSTSPYTLTLHRPLANSYSTGAVVMAEANTLGIGKGITIQGDAKKPVSDLFSATSLQLFPQNGAAAPTALLHLALVGVSGTASSNLIISGDTFTSNGTVTPIDVFSARDLTISNDTFNVESAATLAHVVSAIANAGSITFAGDKITSQSDLSSTAVALSSNSGPIKVSDLQLTAEGTVGGDGLRIDTGGNVTVGGKNNTLSFAKAVGGSGLNLSGGANADVSNVTETFANNVGNDGLRLDPFRGKVTANNLSVTVAGNILGNNGLGAAIDLNADGSAIVSNLNAAVTGSAPYGLSVQAGGNLAVGGTETVNVQGPVSSDGMHLSSSAGNINVSSSLSVTLGSKVSQGLYLYTGGTVTASKPISVNVTGEVSNYGVYI
jgi:hypothetical protein